MSHRMRLWSFVFIAWLVPKMAQAQQAVPDKKPVAADHAADRGLLLGIYFPTSARWENLPNPGPDEKWVPDISIEPHGQYLTFWISRSGDTVKVQATEGLFVPRANGFWHIGAQLVKRDRDSEYNFDEHFWALPAGEKPKPAETDPNVDGKSVRLITYVGPQYVSYLFHWQGGAGAWEYVNPHVASVDDSATDLSIEKVLGPAASAAYKRLAKSLDHMNDEAKEGEEREPCNCCSGIDNEWGILHVGDLWQTYARFHSGTSSACSQGHEDHVLKAVIPKSVASGGILGKPWDVLRAEAEALLKSQQGSVRHLFVSPKQDLAITVGTTGLAVLSVENLHIHSVLKIHAFDRACIPVMEQWSLGRFVTGWDTAIQKEQSAAVPGNENP